MIYLKDIVVGVLWLRDEAKERQDTLPARHQHREGLEKDVDDEVVVIADPDAVIDPRTVMIESFNAVLADAAVAATTRADGVAVWAELRAVHLGQHLIKVDVFIDEVPRLDASGEGKENEADEEDS